MALYESRHTYEPERPFEPWLFAIARNVAADHARRHLARAKWEALTAEPPEGLASRPALGPARSGECFGTIATGSARGLFAAQARRRVAGSCGRAHWDLGRRFEGQSTSRLSRIEEDSEWK